MKTFYEFIQCNFNKSDEIIIVNKNHILYIDKHYKGCLLYTTKGAIVIKKDSLWDEFFKKELMEK